MGSKGDLVDGILRASVLQNEPEQISNYPPHVINVLRCFYITFNIPEGAIPGKKSSGYKNWVLQLEDISKLFTTEERMKMGFELAKQKYDKSHKPIIYQPLSIKPFLVDAIRELKEKLKQKLAEQQEMNNRLSANSRTVPADKEEMKKAIRDIKSFLEE
jgi:hypothetical protein